MAAPKKAMPKSSGKTSIYKGTDKTTNNKDKVRYKDQSVVYADGATFKKVKADISPRDTRVWNRKATASVGGEKNGNVVRTYLTAHDPITWGPNAGSGYMRKRSTETTLGKGGRRESVVKKGQYGNVISETQLNRGSGTRKTGAKNKGF
jgi:hypothetical protein